MSSIFTVLQGTWSTFTIHHSRFVSCAFPLKDPEEFSGILHEARNSWPKASHYVWAYVLGPGQERLTDDGEPQGTAGSPTLLLIQKRDLLYSAIVTVRYFGGTKLGKGGLTRAYQQAASHALSHAQFGRYRNVIKATVKLPYSTWGRTQNFLMQDNITYYPVFVEHVELHCEVSEDDWQSFWTTLKTSIAPGSHLEESQLVTAITPMRQ